MKIPGLLTIVESTPIPAAGVALGLISLGNLLAPYSQAALVVFAVCAAVLAVLVVAKIALFTGSFRDDMQNPVIAGTFATLFMTAMQLASCLAPVLGVVAFVFWAAAVLCHVGLIVWFTLRFVRSFSLKNVFTSWFVAYVGIVVASLTSPSFGMEALGRALFVFGFACYAVLLVTVSVRYARHEIPEAAKPTLCIYAAPMSLSLAGYLSVADTPNEMFVVVLAVLAQILLAIVVTQLPRLLSLSFYPSYAAMTFPFVISATAFGKAVGCLNDAGWVLPDVLSVLIVAETVLAIAMVCYVFARYVHHIASTSSAKAAAAEPAADAQSAMVSAVES